MSSRLGVVLALLIALISLAMNAYLFQKVKSYEPSLLLMQRPGISKERFTVTSNDTDRQLAEFLCTGYGPTIIFRNPDGSNSFWLGVGKDGPELTLFDEKVPHHYVLSEVLKSIEGRKQ